MPSLDPAVAEIRRAVRAALAEMTDAAVVGLSGGADSLALTAALAFEAPKAGISVAAVIVDHGLQPGSAEAAERAAAQASALGLEAEVVRVRVASSGDGPEAAARDARRAALREAVRRRGARSVLLAHTLDDQAETVLLGLARGSGGRSIAGMRRDFPPFHRPFLDLTRAQTEQACHAQGIEFWTDPHNADPRFLRPRVRRRVLPVLEEELGPGVAATLARTADQLREDMEALDRLADAAYLEVEVSGVERERAVVLSVPELTRTETALRRRVLRTAALDAGAIDAELFRVHVLALDELVTAWRGQVMVQLPGHVEATRSGDTLRIGRRPVAG
ncbi:tRNA lysidine(34) synthetase TilS [Microbacterium sp.]|uniref:tRNA lysidine(34) synthetase TilS n=1 Tax=Microbacterium sp. TaxID=51671 RepID=UPI0037366727